MEDVGEVQKWGTGDKMESPGFLPRLTCVGVLVSVNSIAPQESCSTLQSVLSYQQFWRLRIHIVMHIRRQIKTFLFADCLEIEKK